MTRQRDLMRRDAGIGAQLGWIAEQLTTLARVHEGLRDLFTSVLGRDVSLEGVLREVAATAMDLVSARYVALGVLSEDGEHLTEFITLGLTEEEEAAAAPFEVPRGRGLLAHLMADLCPVRVDSISEHPMAMGLPPGHPLVHAVLAVGIRSRGNRYGNLFVADRRDGQPFDEHDETMIVALADAAGLAIDDARLLGQVRNEAEEFQRLLLPQLPDLWPVEAAALYRPAAAPRPIGGDWYDAMRLPDDTYALVIGDIAGHGVHAAAEMAQTRSMLRALLYDPRKSPGAVLTQLDRRLQATTDTPLATAGLARGGGLGDVNPALTERAPLRRGLAGVDGAPPGQLSLSPSGFHCGYESGRERDSRYAGYPALTERAPLRRRRQRERQAWPVRYPALTERAPLRRDRLGLAEGGLRSHPAPPSGLH